MKFSSKASNPTPAATTNSSAQAQTRFECPNCWGTQQWENVERPATEELSKDTTKIGRSREGFIQRFANRYLKRSIRRA